MNQHTSWPARINVLAVFSSHSLPLRRWNSFFVNLTVLRAAVHEVFMLGGLRLFLVLLFSFAVVVTVLADDAAVSTQASSSGPPVAAQKPVEDEVQGHKITDPYRWLEEASGADTQKWVHDEVAYTRSILDPLTGRDQLHKRLSELLTIGTISAPQLGGEYYFYTKREGSQNQPVLFVRKGLNGTDRALVDVNALAADGTVALDWWTPSENGKY